MKKIIAITSLYCLSILIVVNWNTATHVELNQAGIKKTESKTDQPHQFFAFHRGIRTREDASSPAYTPGFITREINLAKSSARARKGRLQSNGVIEWKERGPSNVPGRTRALLNLPGDATNTTWLAGAATGGIWKTNDGGNTWTEKSADFPTLPISSFAMSDANPNLIYAGTGEYVSTRFTAIGDGIFKSTDQGETWTQLSATAANNKFTIVTRIITDPADPNVIVASTVRSFWTTDSDETSIMRSIDGGLNWTEVYTTSGAIEQLIATPGNFQTQFASLNSTGVLKSTDGGLTWSLRNDGMSPNGRLELAISPVTPSKLYASAEGSLSGTGSDLYVSSDAGENWALVDVKIGTTAIDFLIGQGFYDNTILCDPFNENIVYYGGVSLFRSTVGTTSTPVDDYRMKEEGTDFLFLQSFANILWDNQRLTIGGVTANVKKTVEVRFGPGMTQKAHRFFVPAGATSGVPAASYTYQDYVDVPFEVWDVTSIPERQLMVSFRDQNQNGFDLVSQKLGETDPPAEHSREYVYINNVDYSETNNPSISLAGGQEFNLMYNFFPALASGQTWNPNSLPPSTLVIQYQSIPKMAATTITVADSRNEYDGKNTSNQIVLSNGVHPDHHYMIPIVIDPVAKTYKILLATDGGPFVSNTATSPGIVHGNWTFKGNTYITSQFYGADKRPGFDEYIGGLQDNGTRISPRNESASKTTPYSYALGGDGFEVLWHSLDGNKIIGSIYNNRFFRTTNGGQLWSPAFTGFPLVGGVPDPSKYPFFSRLANSKSYPDRIFAIGRDGVWRSADFGESWSLTPITTQWGTNTSFMDVEVSRANANIIWAGNAISSDFRLHVSTNGGASFTATNNYSETMGVVSKLGSHPIEENTAYALFSYADAPKILKTTNLGQTWEDISGFGTNDESSTGFPDVAVFCIYVRPDNPDIIWVGTEIGIVESLDDGQTWALLDDFPNVGVWDMKGQDDQVVIATHGRGIWTAIIEAPQISVITPDIIASGTSPKEKLLLKVKVEEASGFDKIEFYEGVTLLGQITDVDPAEYVITIDGLSPGTKNIKLISYKGTAPFHSKTYSIDLLDILSIENAYSTYFNNISDLTIKGFALQNFPGTITGERKTLQTGHNYSNDFDHYVIMRHPIKVSASVPSLQYEDIAIVEPGPEGAVFGTAEFKDYVVLEGTKNGLDWIPLEDGYNARFNSDWLAAFNSAANGSKSMFVPHELNLSNTFSAGDTLLIRYRLFSNNSITGWGAAINYFAIQQEPTATENPLLKGENLALFPNPTTGNFTVEFNLTRATEVRAEIMDLFGRVVSSNVSQKEIGTHQETFNLSNQPQGSYLVVLRTNSGNKVGKISIKR